MAYNQSSLAARFQCSQACVFSTFVITRDENPGQKKSTISLELSFCTGRYLKPDLNSQLKSCGEVFVPREFDSIDKVKKRYCHTCALDTSDGRDGMGLCAGPTEP